MKSIFQMFCSLSCLAQQGMDYLLIPDIEDEKLAALRTMEENIPKFKKRTKETSPGSDSGIGMSQDDDEDDCDDGFTDFQVLNDRFRKTFYYGPKTSCTGCSWPLTQLVAENFSSVPLAYDSDPAGCLFVSSTSRDLGLHPASIIYALTYLDHLPKRFNKSRHSSARFLSTSELFISSIVVASKILYDVGEEYDVYNKHWAEECDLTLEEFNKLETQLCLLLKWKISPSKDEFFKKLSKVEAILACREARKRKTEMTYSEINSVSNVCVNRNVVQDFIGYLMKSIATLSASYLTCIVMLSAIASGIGNVDKPAEKGDVLLKNVNRQTIVGENITRVDVGVSNEDDNSYKFIEDSEENIPDSKDIESLFFYVRTCLDALEDGNRNISGFNYIPVVEQLVIPLSVRRITSNLAFKDRNLLTA